MSLLCYEQTLTWQWVSRQSITSCNPQFSNFWFYARIQPIIVKKSFPIKALYIIKQFVSWWLWHMIKDIKENLYSYVFSFILGGLVFYVFICFNGIVTAHMVDSGIFRFIFREVCSITSSIITRKIFFVILELLQRYVTLFLIITLFIYFPIKAISRQVFINSILLTLGAISADQIMSVSAYQDFSFVYFSFSLFLENVILTFLVNIALWLVLTLLAVKFAIFIKAKSKGVITN